MVRYSNFGEDNKIGKIGERDFAENYWKVFSNDDYYIGKRWELRDVSYDSIYQKSDIDFLLVDDITKSVYDLYSDYGKQRMVDSSLSVGSSIRVEVKTDTRTAETGNIVYEVKTHNKPGCGLVTKADYFYYVCVDSKQYDNILRRFLIDIKKLRKYIKDNKERISDDGNTELSEDNPMTWKRVTKPKKNGEMDDEILDILVSIKVLLNTPDKIAREIFF